MVGLSVLKQNNYICEAKEDTSTLIHLSRSGATHGYVLLLVLYEDVLVEKVLAVVATDMRVIGKEAMQFITYVGACLHVSTYYLVKLVRLYAQTRVSGIHVVHPKKSLRSDRVPSLLRYHGIVFRLWFFGSSGFFDFPIQNTDTRAIRVMLDLRSHTPTQRHTIKADCAPFFLNSRLVSTHHICYQCRLSQVPPRARSKMSLAIEPKWV